MQHQRFQSSYSFLSPLSSKDNRVQATLRRRTKSSGMICKLLFVVLKCLPPLVNELRWENPDPGDDKKPSKTTVSSKRWRVDYQFVFLWLKPMLQGYGKGLIFWNVVRLKPEQWQPPLHVTGGGLSLKPPKFEHIFIAVITFPPFLLCWYFWYQLARPHSICDPTSNNNHNSGMLHKKINKNHYITATCFSKPQTNLGICSSRRLGDIFATVWEVQFFEWPLPFWMYLLRKGAYRDISHIIWKQTQ